jgi:hypothetical protein
MSKLDKNYKELRHFALNYVVRNIEPNGNANAFKNLQNCFIAGYNHGRLLTEQEIAKCAEMSAWSTPSFSSINAITALVSFLLGMLIRGWM